MLVTLKELLDQAKVEHKAVGAFNGTTLEESYRQQRN